MKVCLVGSSGGHLTHLYMLKPFWKDTKRNCDEIDDVRRKLDLPLGKVIYVYSGGFIDRKNQREAITAFLAMKDNKAAEDFCHDIEEMF